MYSINQNKFISKCTIGSENECWNYVGYLDKDRYDIFDGYRAHRIAYFLRNGKFDQSHLVLHICDNRCCVNPNHLYLGNHLDNMQDRYDRNRIANGENNGWSILTDADVLSILDMINDDQFTIVDQISEYFNCSNHPIYRILSGQNWTHITDNFNLVELRKKIIIIGNPKLTEMDVIDIKMRLKHGESPMKIYKDYSEIISNYTIYDIKNGRSWKNIHV